MRKQRQCQQREDTEYHSRLPKMDKPTANPDRIMQQLTEYSLVPEEWGGDTIVCKISAKTGLGIDNLLDMGHGVNLVRKGVSGKTQNQLVEFDMKINNPALTAQILVAVARASFKQQPGAYTMIELPVIDMICGDREDLIKRLV